MKLTPEVAHARATALAKEFGEWTKKIHELGEDVINASTPSQLNVEENINEEKANAIVKNLIEEKGIKSFIDDFLETYERIGSYCAFLEATMEAYDMNKKILKDNHKMAEQIRLKIGDLLHDVDKKMKNKQKGDNPTFWNKWFK